MTSKTDADIAFLLRMLAVDLEKAIAAGEIKVANTAKKAEAVAVAAHFFEDRAQTGGTSAALRKVFEGAARSAPPGLSAAQYHAAANLADAVSAFNAKPSPERGTVMMRALARWKEVE